MELTLAELIQLIKLADQYNITELEFKCEGIKLKASRQKFTPFSSTLEGVEEKTPTSEVEVKTLLSSTTTEAKEKIVIVEEETETLPPEEYFKVTSPLAGIFYRAPWPGAEPFVEVGDNVKKGQALCIVEAMKLMNEIQSEIDGTVIKILPKNEDLVQEGEVLFWIKPL